MDIAVDLGTIGVGGRSEAGAPAEAVTILNPPAPFTSILYQHR